MIDSPGEKSQKARFAVGILIAIVGLGAGWILFGGSGIPKCGSDIAKTTISRMVIDIYLNASSHRNFLAVVAPAKTAQLPDPVFDLKLTNLREQPSSSGSKRYCSADLVIGYNSSWYESAMKASTKLTRQEQNNFGAVASLVGVNILEVSKSFDFTLQQTEDGKTYVEIQ